MTARSRQAGAVTRGHRPRVAWRPLASAALALIAVPTSVLLPGVGAPLIYLALRLLATRYTWARRADQKIRALLERATRAWRARRRAAQLLLTALGVLLAVVAPRRTVTGLAA